jgi:hypothetical protein
VRGALLLPACLPACLLPGCLAAWLPGCLAAWPPGCLMLLPCWLARAAGPALLLFACWPWVSRPLLVMACWSSAGDTAQWSQRTSTAACHSALSLRRPAPAQAAPAPPCCPLLAGVQRAAAGAGLAQGAQPAGGRRDELLRLRGLRRLPARAVRGAAGCWGWGLGLGLGLGAGAGGAGLQAAGLDAAALEGGCLRGPQRCAWRPETEPARAAPAQPAQPSASQRAQSPPRPSSANSLPLSCHAERACLRALPCRSSTGTRPSCGAAAEGGAGAGAGAGGGGGGARTSTRA